MRIRNHSDWTDGVGAEFQQQAFMGLLNNSLHFAKKLHKASAPIRSKKSVQPCPEQSRREGRIRFNARSVRCVRERECREERHVCEPDGRQNGENAAGLSACGTHRLASFFDIPFHGRYPWRIDGPVRCHPCEDQFLDRKISQLGCPNRKRISASPWARASNSAVL